MAMNYAIIAAGNGSRLSGEGVACPKPLVELDGRPMIGRLVDIFVANGAGSISVIVNESMPDVARYLANAACPVPLNVVCASTPSSMHSLHRLAPLIPNGKFILTTVDTVFSEALFAQYAAAFEADDICDGFMAVTDYIDDEKPLYVRTDADGMITAFTDEPFDGVKYVSGGIYGLKSPQATEILADCVSAGEQRLRNFQRALIARGCRLKAWPMSRIIDVDHAGDIAKARAIINEYIK